jgi:predicted Zn-dependent peptidase
MRLCSTLVVLALGVLAGCPRTPTTEENKPVPPDPIALDAPPQLGPPKPYRAPQPQVYKTPQGMTVWLIERRELPLVGLSLALPSGSSEDPPGKAGLAHITAAMLDEGAGDRGALEISTALNDLGADMATSVDRDGSNITLQVLKKHLPKAFDIFADVIARPRFEADEWKRVSTLWKNQLRRRADSPQAVAMVVSAAVLYGPDTPYGHPSGGQVDTAERIALAEAKRFYEQNWRPDEAILIAAGDITKSELDALIAEKLGSWTAPADEPGAEAPVSVPLTTRPRLVLVDRADAPQAVISAVGVGVAASSPSAPLLDLVNTALGGSFTSRLNQNLREDKSWTYGASSAFVETRGIGPFVAQSAVFVQVTGAAVREVLGEIDKMAKSGLTPEEHVKVRARDLTQLIETYETIGGLVGRLSSLALLGLAYDYDAKASHARQAASREELAGLARGALEPSKLTVVVVGPRDALLPQLRSLGLGEPEMWMPEGRPVAAR